MRHTMPMSLCAVAFVACATLALSRWNAASPQPSSLPIQQLQVSQTASGPVVTGLFGRFPASGNIAEYGKDQIDPFLVESIAKGVAPACSKTGCPFGTVVCSGCTANTKIHSAAPCGAGCTSEDCTTTTNTSCCDSCTDVNPASPCDGCDTHG